MIYTNIVWNVKHLGQGTWPAFVWYLNRTKAGRTTSSYFGFGRWNDMMVIGLLMSMN